MFLRFTGQVLLSVALSSAASLAEDLPGAPEPQEHVTVPATRPASTQAVAGRRWSPIVEPGEKIPALTNRQKLLFPLHETYRWTTPILLLYSGEYGILRDNNPHFGVNAGGFGDRVGAAGLRLESSRFFSDGVFPILLHEDPRYYRKAYGTYPTRALYAVSRTVVTQRDDGTSGFNFSDVLGRGVSAALTQTYYPQSSIGSRVVFTTWGISLAQLAGVNFAYEFWPDVKRKFFHRSQ